MKEPNYQIPRKMLSKVGRQDLGVTELKVMLIILEEMYGWHIDEGKKLAASYILRALHKEVTHSNINIINKALKKLKTKGIISYPNKKGIINKIKITDDFKAYNPTGVRKSTNIQPRSCKKIQPKSCISKDISKDKKEVRVTTGPGSPAPADKDLSYDKPKVVHAKTNQEITDEIAIMFPRLKEAGITYSYGSNRFMDKDGKTPVFFEDISYDSKRKLFVNRAGEVKIM